MNKSETTTKIFQAIIKANARIKAVAFDSTNPYYKSRYASLGAVLDAVKPIYAEEGLSILQPPSNEGNQVGIENIVIHESGEWISNQITLDLGEQKKPAEAAGIAISYLRRYSLAAITGLYAEQDTDGDLQAKIKAMPDKAPTGNQTRTTPESTVSRESIEQVIGVQGDLIPTDDDPELAAAKNEVGSDGKKYGDLTIDELKAKLNGLNITIKKQPSDALKLPEYMRKREAVIKILNAKLKSA